MATAPATEYRGRGWTLSLQRQRGAPEPGLSSNLGAAPLVALGRRGSAARLAARLADGERLWLSVIAATDIPVAARLPDGRDLVDEAIGDGGDGGGGGGAIHRLARIEGADAEGVGADDAPVFDRVDPDAESLALRIGDRRLSIALVRADAFDRTFGASPGVEGEPAVYQGWPLP